MEDILKNESNGSEESPAGVPERTPEGASEGTPEKAPEGTPEIGAPTTPAASESQEPQGNPRMKWYIIHAYSGFERKVRESLESRIRAFGLEGRMGRVLIPTETVTEIRNNKKYTRESMFYPGYVLIEMDMDDEVWHMAGREGSELTKQAERDQVQKERDSTDHRWAVPRPFRCGGRS